MKKKKFVLYTAIFGAPGRFNFAEISNMRVDRFCYTDFSMMKACPQIIPVRKNRHIKNDFYTIKIMKLDHMIAVMRQRSVKILIPDEIFENYEYSAYVDCKRPIEIDFEKCEELLNEDIDSDFLTRIHNKRDCVYEEAKKCINVKKGKRSDIIKQMKFYKKEQYPIHNGLYNTMWLFRRHTKRLRHFMNLWWSELIRFSHRDQISLPYIAWKHGMKITLFSRIE